MLLTENSKLVLASQIVTADNAITGDWVDMTGYHKCRIHVLLTRGADSTAAAITVDKACTVAGGTESTGITMNNFWYLVDYVPGTNTSTALTKGTAAATIATDTTQSKTHYYVIEIDSAELPNSTADYDCIQVNVAASNAANYHVAFYELYEPRHTEDLGGVDEPIS